MTIMETRAHTRWIIQNTLAQTALLERASRSSALRVSRGSPRRINLRVDGAACFGSSSTADAAERRIRTLVTIFLYYDYGDTTFVNCYLVRLRNG